MTVNELKMEMLKLKNELQNIKCNLEGDRRYMEFQKKEIIDLKIRVKFLEEGQVYQCLQNASDHSDEENPKNLYNETNRTQQTVLVQKVARKSITAAMMKRGVDLRGNKNQDTIRQNLKDVQNAYLGSKKNSSPYLHHQLKTLHPNLQMINIEPRDPL